MLVIRDIMYCKPGMVRPMVANFLALKKMVEQGGHRMRVLTDVAAERYWTVVTEMEVENMEGYMAMVGGDQMKDVQELMRGYHELVDYGRREIYTVEEEG